MRCRTVRHLFLAAAGALTVAQAQADVIKLDHFSHGYGALLAVDSPAYIGLAGEFNGTRDGDAFVTFCADLLQSFNFGSTYSDYGVVGGVDAFGAARSLALDHALSAFMAPGAIDTAATSAAAQAMIWEILYEADDHYDLSSGSFRAHGSGAAQEALDAMQWSALADTPVTYHVDKLFSPTNQDFLVVTAASAVPEPTSIALVATGLLGLAAARRRKDRKN